MQTILKVFIVMALLVQYKAQAWEYNDQNAWYDIPDAECGGFRQSPIELISSESYLSPIITPITYRNYDVPQLTPALLVNNGHAADLQLGKTNSPSITGGPLSSNKYEATSLHFHVGSRDTHGSEHVIDEIRYSMEMHIVHINTKYENMKEAMANNDGLAVLAILFEADPSYQTDFEGLNQIVDSLEYIKAFNSSTQVVNLIPNNLFNATDIKRYFNYEGSLTTPPCSEAVNWIVFSKSIKISENQINRFRALSDANGNPLVNNFRQLQAKGNRKVFRRPRTFLFN